MSFMVYGNITKFFTQYVKTKPDTSAKVWDFSDNVYDRNRWGVYYSNNEQTDNCIKEASEYEYSEIEEWIYSNYKEYVNIGNSSYLRKISIIDEHDYFSLELDSLINVSKEKPILKSFNALYKGRNSFPAKGEYYLYPEIEGTLIMSKGSGIPASMSVENIVFDVYNADTTIDSLQLDSIPKYMIKTFRWKVKGRDFPVALMLVIRKQYADSCSADTLAYCVREEWITRKWKTQAKDIDVIPVNKEGFEFYLPGGCEAVEVDVRVTAQDGTDYGTAHFNLMPAESYFMKVPGMAQGAYYIYVTVNDETFKNKRTIR